MRLFAAVAAVTLLASVAGAQGDKHAFVRVVARDSAGAAIPGAEVKVTKGFKDVVIYRNTDEQGQAVFPVDVKDSSEFQVAVRKIGYKRGDRVFEVGPHDTAVVNVVVAVAPPINAVKITAKRNHEDKYNSYDLGADEIDSFDGWLESGWDVVKKLRPVMLTSRGGCATGAQEVWVNGKRIRLPLRPTREETQKALANVPLRARFTYTPLSVLLSIAPEHIAEIHYHDCFDTSMAAVGNNDAIFVTLKPGVVYVQDVGTYAISPAEEQKLAKKQ